MLKNPQTEEQMIEEGAEFKVGKTYYKTINGELYRSQLDSLMWRPAYHHNRSYYEVLSNFVDLRVKVRDESNVDVKNELYASLELQITMAQDYSEWLKQETERNNELLESHSAALSRLNKLMVQSPSEDEKLDSNPAQELPDMIRWEDAPEWANMLGKSLDDGGKELVWCNSHNYMYFDYYGSFFFDGYSRFCGLKDLEIIAIRPEGV